MTPLFRLASLRQSLRTRPPRRRAPRHGSDVAQSSGDALERRLNLSPLFAADDGYADDEDDHDEDESERDDRSGSSSGRGRQAERFDAVELSEEPVRRGDRHDDDDAEESPREQARGRGNGNAGVTNSARVERIVADVLEDMREEAADAGIDAAELDDVIPQLFEDFEVVIETSADFDLADEESHQNFELEAEVDDEDAPEAGRGNANDLSGSARAAAVPQGRGFDPVDIDDVADLDDFDDDEFVEAVFDLLEETESDVPVFTPELLEEVFDVSESDDVSVAEFLVARIEADDDEFEVDEIDEPAEVTSQQNASRGRQAADSAAATDLSGNAGPRGNGARSVVVEDDTPAEFDDVQDDSAQDTPTVADEPTQTEAPREAVVEPEVTESASTETEAVVAEAESEPADSESIGTTQEADDAAETETSEPATEADEAVSHEEVTVEAEVEADSSESDTATTESETAARVASAKASESDERGGEPVESVDADHESPDGSHSVDSASDQGATARGNATAQRSVRGGQANSAASSEEEASSTQRPSESKPTVPALDSQLSAGRGQRLSVRYSGATGKLELVSGGAVNGTGEAAETGVRDSEAAPQQASVMGYSLAVAGVLALRTWWFTGRKGRDGSSGFRRPVTRPDSLDDTRDQQLDETDIT